MTDLRIVAIDMVLANVPVELVLKGLSHVQASPDVAKVFELWESDPAGCTAQLAEILADPDQPQVGAWVTSLADAMGLTIEDLYPRLPE